MKSFLIQVVLLVASVAANPAPDAAPAPAPVPAPAPDVADASGLHIRADLHKRNGMLYCGIAAPGDGPNLRALYNDFGGETYTAPANGCIRAKCWNTSGVYVCNDKNTPLTVSGNEIKKHLNNILDHCCFYHTDWSWNGGFEQAGQQFTDALGGFNVVGSYADCKENKYTKPTNAGGWGVNGKACQVWQDYIG